MSAKYTYRHTQAASYIGYIVQAIVNNLAPLLFVTFNTRLGISLEKLGLLVFANFFVQILVDLISAKYAVRIGYRRALLVSGCASTAGLALMGVLPRVMADAYAALLIAMFLTAVGGGLLEVLISPIVESLPTREKASSMSLLHSFYCWGHVGVVLLSTLYFAAVGIERWHWLPILWAVVPLGNLIFFARVPLPPVSGDEQPASLRALFSSGILWMFLVLMLCAGASEQAMGQWSSMFAEAGLGVSKAMGDLLGPCAFAAMMGLGRLLYGIFGARINISRALLFSACLCVFSYLLTVFSPWPILSLAGCALTGFSVALMWPGTYSLAAVRCPMGGTAMFAVLALAGDVGCSVGPGLVGLVSGGAQRAGAELAAAFGGNGYIRVGLLAAIGFPLTMGAGIIALRRRRQDTANAGIEKRRKQ